MIYHYIIKYRIKKNSDYFIFEKLVDFREIVDLIVFENKKHKDNFEIMNIRRYIRSLKYEKNNSRC